MPDPTLPAPLRRAGFTPEILRELDHLLVGCGGFVKELISFTSGASTLKDAAGQRVSAADRLVDALLTARLQTLVPSSSGYSEERGAFGERGGGLEVRWQVDPVDGTRPAMLGGAFAVCAGALILEQGQPTAALGWVYVPTLSALYRAVLTAGEAGEAGVRECLLNGVGVCAASVAEADLKNSYLAVGSDWRSTWLPRSPLKLSAPGATAVHLTRLVQPGSDVVAAVLSRYYPYDAAAALVAAIAGGCELYGWSAEAASLQPLEPLRLLAELDARPDVHGPRVLVCAPGVAAALA